MPDFQVKKLTIGLWHVATVVFVAEKKSLALSVNGIIGNSVADSNRGKQRQVDWKKNIATNVKERRGPTAWEASGHYAISIGFSFCMKEHGNQPLDVENFLKPTIDALAAGLFCSNEQDIAKIERYNYDDSGFRHLFVHRLDDTADASAEGIGIYVSLLH